MTDKTLPELMADLESSLRKISALSDPGVLEAFSAAQVAASETTDRDQPMLEMKDAPQDGTWVMGIFEDGQMRQMRWAPSRTHAPHWRAFGQWTPFDPIGWLPMPKVRKIPARIRS